MSSRLLTATECQADYHQLLIPHLAYRYRHGPYICHPAKQASAFPAIEPAPRRSTFAIGGGTPSMPGGSIINAPSLDFYEAIKPHLPKLLPP